MKTIILGLFIFLSSFSFGQIGTFNWVNQIGTVKNDQKTYTAVASDNSVFTASDYDNGGMIIKKFDSNGTELFTKSFYGKVQPSDLFIDANDNIYVIGDFKNQVDFDPNAGETNLGYINYQSLSFNFVAKYSSTGNLILAKQTGGSAFSVSVDSDNNIYLTGTFKNSEDFDPSTTVTNTQTSFDGYSMFITKLNSTGVYVWNKVIGKTTASTSGFGTVQGLIILNDPNDNIVISGSFTDDVDFDLGVGITSYNSGGSYHTPNPFTLKLTKDGDFVWAKYFHSNQESKPKGMVMDKDGNIFTTGVLYGFMDFDSSANTLYLNHTYQLVPYISKMDSNGSILWAKKNFSTDYSVELNDIKLDDAGNIFTLGSFRNTINYTTILGTGTATTAQYSQNLFFTGLNKDGNLVFFNHLGGPAYTFARDLVIKNGSIYIAGSFSETVDFDTSTTVQNLTSAGLVDNFILKYSTTTLQNSSFEQSANFVVFPNPTTSSLNLNFSNPIENGNLKITSLLGQTILEKQNLSGTDFSLDVSKLSSGTYILNLTNGNTKLNKKFIKK